MKKIVFTGPESSGKTTLAKKMFNYYSSELVLEYAREYLNEKGKEYNQNDLLEIAKNQFINQEKALISFKDFVFFDTDLLTIKIWSEYKYGNCDSYILNTILKQNIDLYILCKPDFNWEKDELRENPENQNELYEIYKKELENYKFPFIEVEGNVENRIKKIKKHLK